MGKTEFTNIEKYIRTRDLKNLKPVAKYIEMKFPARIHITLIDANRFISERGTGGIGFAVQMDNIMTISLADEDCQNAPKESTPLISHITSITKKILGYEQGIQVNFHNHPFFRPHTGVGYSTAILTSCTYGLNMLFGAPLNTEEIRDLVIHNYVEVLEGKLSKETEAATVTTGVGGFLTLKGGFVIVGGDFRIIYNSKFFPSYFVSLIDPGVVRIPGEQATASAMQKILREDEAFRYHKAYLILMDLIPALYSEDFETIGDIIWRLQFGGNNLLEGEKYEDGGKRISEVMHALRFSQKPRPIVSISAEGPIICAISKNIDIIHKVCDELNLRSFVTQVDNEGLKVMKKGNSLRNPLMSSDNK